MLVIRNEQMEELHQAAVRDFVRDLTRYLSARINSPADSWESDLLFAVKQAQQLGIVRECDVAEFCDGLYASTGSLDFRKLPRRAQSILLAYREDPQEKLRRFKSWIEQHNAREHIRG